MPILCSVDRDFVMVVERALAAASVTSTLSPDPSCPLTHYHIWVAEEDVDRARSALLARGASVPEASA